MPTYLTAPNLARFDWLEHGFGSRFFVPPGHLTTLRQIHSDITVHADRTGCPTEGDALLSSTPGVLVGVKTADCIPILLVDERQRAVAAVHAGWRGAASQIALKAIQAMKARPEDLHAAIGPGIGPCCYEVGPEVAARFGIDGRAHIDLADINRRQLLSAGIESIYVAGLCTFCNADQFHSFRRDREAAGRMISFIGVKAAPLSQYETSAGTDRSS